MVKCSNFGILLHLTELMRIQQGVHFITSIRNSTSDLLGGEYGGSRDTFDKFIRGKVAEVVVSTRGLSDGLWATRKQTIC
jgi:hypothetical protein